jgi:hypothetical protein
MQFVKQPRVPRPACVIIRSFLARRGIRMGYREETANLAVRDGAREQVDRKRGLLAPGQTGGGYLESTQTRFALAAGKF